MWNEIAITVVFFQVNLHYLFEYYWIIYAISLIWSTGLHCCFRGSHLWSGVGTWLEYIWRNYYFHSFLNRTGRVINGSSRSLMSFLTIWIFVNVFSDYLASRPIYGIGIMAHIEYTSFLSLALTFGCTACLMCVRWQRSPIFEKFSKFKMRLVII